MIRFLLIFILPAVPLPVIILGGIYGGVFTPAEAAVVGLIYSLLVTLFVYRFKSFGVCPENPSHRASVHSGTGTADRNSGAPGTDDFNRKNSGENRGNAS